MSSGRRLDSRTAPAGDATLASDETEAASAETYPGDTGPRAVGGRLGLAVGTILEDVYEVKGRLGAGAMGMVYLVEHLGLGKEFALKMVDGTRGLDADAIARLRNEARIASAVEHENVVSLTHLGRAADGNLFIVMERLRGEDLADRLARQRRDGESRGVPPWLPDDEVRAIVDGVLCGLGAAHAAHVVHRDLKPGNIVLAATRAGVRPKIVDFGIGKLRRPSHADLRGTAPGAIMGTPLYMAPEQARSSADVDERADLYSMGVVAYEMLTGRAPLEGANVLQLIARQATEAPRDPSELRPDLPSTVARHVLRALAKDPGQRFQSADEMREDWTRAWQGARSSAPGPAPASAAGARVLFVEDDADIRQNVLELLEAEAFVAVGAATGEEGVAAALARPPDLVLCDVTLPGIDGYEVFARLAADGRTRGVPFVFLSGLAERSAIRRGMNLGADDYLTKPFGRAELLEAVRSRLAARSRRQG